MSTAKPGPQRPPHETNPNAAATATATATKTHRVAPPASRALSRPSHCNQTTRVSILRLESLDSLDTHPCQHSVIGIIPLRT